MNEVITIILSMIISAVLGAVAVLLIGGSFTVKYLGVKASRGKKVLLFVKTNFSWTPVVATKIENTLYWKHNKIKYITDIEDEYSITRFKSVEAAYTLLEKPTVALKISEGGLYPPDFDPETFNNLLVRAATRPSPTEQGEVKKLTQILLVLLIIVILGVVLVYGKVSALDQAVKALNVVGGAVI